MISTPVIAYVRKAAGPVSDMTVPEPTNSPAPITPPMAIMVRCRCLRPFLSSVGGAAPIASPRGGRAGQYPTSAGGGMSPAPPHATAGVGDRHLGSGTGTWPLMTTDGRHQRPLRGQPSR